MSWSAEDRSWLEQRLDQHKRDIQAQLEQHFMKLAERGDFMDQSCYHPPNQSATVTAEGPPAAEEAMTLRGLTSTPASEQINGKGQTPTSVTTLARNASSNQRQLTTSPSGLQDLLKRGGSMTSSMSKDPTKTHMRSVVEDTPEEVIDPASMRGKVSFFLNNFNNHFINFCVLANTIVMFLELQCLGSVANESLGSETDTGWSKVADILRIFEFTFAAIFLLDLVLQVYAFRLPFFNSKFNVIDAVVVVITSLEVFVLAPLASSVGNVSVVRLLRLLKMTRAIKAARTFKTAEGLRVLVAVMAFSFGSTFWSLVILVVFQLIGSIFMCHSLHYFVIDSSNDLVLRLWVNRMYGDGVKSFWTIFELTFSGCWPNYARRIVEEVHPVYALFYFTYVYIVVFVATRIVSALFVRETLAQYTNDAETMVKERSRKLHWMHKSLDALFDEADENGDGVLSNDELRSLFDNPKVKLWLKELGVDASDSDTLIELLSSGEDWDVNREEFVHGITKLKGEARSQDLVPVYNHVRRILGHVKELRDLVERLAQQNATTGSTTVTF